MTELEATPLTHFRWAVRPKGALGMAGWINGRGWRAIFVTAQSEGEALKKAMAWRIWDEARRT